MKLLFYDDSPVFGGHEEMSIRIANLLADQYEVMFAYHSASIEDKLDAKISKIKIKTRTRGPFSVIRAISPTDILSNIRLFSIVKPDIIVVCQGAIEMCVSGLIAARILKIKVISYIPICTDLRVIDARFAKIREFIDKFIFRAFDLIITVSKVQEKLITDRGVVLDKVRVLFNHLPTSMKAGGIKQKRGENEKTIEIGIAGRIHFHQKGQEKLVPIAQQLLKLGIKFKVKVFGDGPDKKVLVSMIEAAKLADYFEFCGWVSNKNEIYSLVDIMISTSNYEGFPLVLLESIYWQTPFFAPSIPEFREFLPAEFCYHSYAHLAHMLNSIAINRVPDFRQLVTDLSAAYAQKYSEVSFERSLFKLFDELKQ